jgi:predicted ATP-dependent serine protease
VARERSRAFRLASRRRPAVYAEFMHLIGREAAVAALHRLVDDALGGAGHLALIGGEAGIGKTVIAAETAGYAAERGAATVWGACVEGGGVPAYWPW